MRENSGTQIMNSQGQLVSDQSAFSVKDMSALDALLPGKHRKKACCNRYCFFDSMTLVGKSLLSVGVGFSTGIVLRLALSAFKVQDPVIFEASGHRAEVSVTDVIACVTSLLLCSFFVKPTSAHGSNKGCEPSLFFRNVLRGFVPFVLGLGLMFASKAIEFAIKNVRDPIIPGPNGSRLFEVSDVVGMAVLLLAFHAIDITLEYCCASDPRHVSLPSDEDDSSIELTPTVGY